MEAKQQKKRGGERVSRLKAERVQELLKLGWRVVNGGIAIERVRVLPEVRQASSYATYVLDLGEAHRLPVKLRISGARVAVNLPLASRRNDKPDQEEALMAFAHSLG